MKTVLYIINLLLFAQIGYTQQVHPNIDEQQFRQFFIAFKTAIKNNNQSAVKSMLYFPLQTQPQWSNEDMKSVTINPAARLITKEEYPKYQNVIFTKDAIRLIPQATEDNLSEIDNHTDEGYYNTLKKATDNGSTLYELQQQYVQDNGKETSYGFVFGKVQGKYKVISFFSPWPVKE